MKPLIPKSIQRVRVCVIYALAALSIAGCGKGAGSALGGGGGGGSGPTVTPMDPNAGGGGGGGGGGGSPAGFQLKAQDQNAEGGAPGSPYTAGNSKVSKVAVGGNVDKGAAAHSGGNFKVRGGVSRSY